MGVKKILILDDSEFVLEIARSVLAGAGYDVSTALTVDDFESALPKVRPDIIITDIFLPEMYGDDACITLKKRFGLADIPIVLYSDLNEAELEERTRNSGATGFICKTWGSEKFVEAVKKFLPPA